LPISTAHAAALRRLPYVGLGGRPQRDPFDRLLVAQAMVEGAPVVTCDRGIAAHGVPTLW